VCFYAYFLSAFFFILMHVCKNWNGKDNSTDILKTQRDFIWYSKDELIWFAFNFICTVVPLIIVLTVVSRRKGEQCYTGTQQG
jgi:hypothetical protein